MTTTEPLPSRLSKVGETIKNLPHEYLELRKNYYWSCFVAENAALFAITGPLGLTVLSKLGFTVNGIRTLSIASRYQKVRGASNIIFRTFQSIGAKQALSWARFIPSLVWSGGNLVQSQTHADDLEQMIEAQEKELRELNETLEKELHKNEHQMEDYVKKLNDLQHILQERKIELEKMTMERNLSEQQLKELDEKLKDNHQRIINAEFMEKYTELELLKNQGKLKELPRNLLRSRNNYCHQGKPIGKHILEKLDVFYNEQMTVLSIN